MSGKRHSVNRERSKAEKRNHRRSALRAAAARAALRRHKSITAAYWRGDLADLSTLTRRQK